MVKVQTKFYQHGKEVSRVTKYRTRKLAQKMVDVTLKWGIHIISSEIVSDNRKVIEFK